LFNIKL